jgi:hypothetical protein
MRKTILEWSATRVSTVGAAAASMAIADFRTVSPKIACPAIFAFPVRKDCWRTESVLIFCGYFRARSGRVMFNIADMLKFIARPKACLRDMGWTGQLGYPTKSRPLYWRPALVRANYE